MNRNFVIKATHPDFEYRPLFPPEELGDAGRVRWVSGTPGKPPAYAGTDLIVGTVAFLRSIFFSTIVLKAKCATVQKAAKTPLNLLSGVAL
jgi:hypothetical protein